MRAITSKKSGIKADNRGATLVELITSVAIFGIVVLASIGLLTFVTQVNSGEYSFTIETRRIVQTERAIKNAAYSSGKIYTDGTKSMIYFDHDSQNGEPDIILDSESGEIRYKGLTLMSDVKKLNVDVAENYKYAEIRIVMNDDRTYSIFITAKNG